MLGRIQNDLFDLGADLCTPEGGAREITWTPLRIVKSQVERLEQEIDAMNALLEPLEILRAAGRHADRDLSPSRADHLPAGRAADGRARRQEGETVSKAALQYVNRLSDHLFVASRYLNHKDRGDVLWVPGQNREPRRPALASMMFLNFLPRQACRAPKIRPSSSMPSPSQAETLRDRRFYGLLGFAFPVEGDAKHSSCFGRWGQADDRRCGLIQITGRAPKPPTIRPSRCVAVRRRSMPRSRRQGQATWSSRSHGTRSGASATRSSSIRTAIRWILRAAAGRRDLRPPACSSSSSLAIRRSMTRALTSLWAASSTISRATMAKPRP